MTEDKCPVCSGDLSYLGSMAHYNWYRCRNCGSDVGKPGNPFDLREAHDVEDEVEYDDDFEDPYGYSDHDTDESEHMSDYYGEET